MPGLLRWDAFNQLERLEANATDSLCTPPATNHTKLPRPAA